MHNCNLILIDDDMISLIITQQFLKRHSGFGECQIESFSNPELALESVRLYLEDQQAPILWILLDINMPIMNGWEFLDQLTEFNLNERAKVIMLTSSISEDDRSKADSYNFVCGFLSKPIDPNKVQQVFDTIESNPNRC